MVRNRYAQHQLKECIEDYNQWYYNNRTRLELERPLDEFLVKAVDGLLFICNMLYTDQIADKSGNGLWLPDSFLK